MSKKAIINNAMQELDDIMDLQLTEKNTEQTEMAVGLLDQEWRMVVKGLQGELDSKIERQLRNIE